ncbi:FAD-binding protein [Candidatus Bathyarchaeota archaeon]|nr:FAD-binding protein [Candidatus Bathyarchaeota archaeon]
MSDFKSGYPEYMQESLKKVSETRSSRFGKEFTPMTAEQRIQILEKFHPDWKPQMKRGLKIGPSKGMLIPHEVADIIESHSMIKHDEIDLTKIDYDLDVLIIGGGGAGLSAGILAKESGIPADKILLVQKLRLGDANSKMAQGGIQAADTSIDNPAIHYLDVIGGGHYANKPDLVEALVKDAPDVIKWHESLGVMYDKNPDGTMLEIAGGGTSRNRMHSCKDYTGLELTRVVLDEFINKEIGYTEFTSAVELLMDDKEQVAGAVLYDLETKEYHIARSKSTILATGGFGRLHIQGFATTNHYGATGDGIVMAYRTGAILRDLDSTQYHPTGAAFPEQIVGQLATEKLRGRGAQPVNKYGELFVYHLEPRDIESSSYIRECYERDNGIVTPTGMKAVWLDTPMIEKVNGSGTIEREFAAMFRNFNRWGIDIRKEPMLVFPTLHYQNGGVEINANTETNIAGLLCAGEVCGGVHGKNRLMGNSQLEIYVFGRRAGRAAAKRASKTNLGELNLNHVKRYDKWLEEAGIITERKSPIILPEYRGEKTLSHQLKIM